MKKYAYKKPSLTTVELASCHRLCSISDTGNGWDVIPPDQPNQPAGANRNGNVWDDDCEEDCDEED